MPGNKIENQDKGNQDRRPLFVCRIFEELKTDAKGRRYREGAIWQFQSKKKTEPDEAGAQA